MNTIKNILNKLDKLSDYFLMLCLGIMGVVLFMQVVFRYVLKDPLIWSEEAARYLHVWITLFGIRFGLKNKAHLNVSFFFNKFNQKVQSFIKLFTDIFIIICIIIYLPGALLFVQDQKLIVSSAMGVNMGLVYVPAILGFISAIFYLLNECFKSLTAILGKMESETGPEKDAIQEVV
ncbi:MAG: TRAP transporter small permease [Spirochaetales bacterium]|nr:TRAP transporter small permease [Spirochaetales bacterium]